MSLAPIDAAAFAALAWLAIGAAGLAFRDALGFVARVLFPAGAVVGVGVAAVGLIALGGPPVEIVLPLGLPDLPFQIRLDALSAFFMVLLGLASAGVSVFAAGYFRAGEGASPGLLCLQYHLFLASMLGVLLADDAYLFMVCWETMALASFFLVTTQHRIAEIRAAGYLYLLVAHVGALAILLAFGVLHGEGDYSFGAMRAAQLTPFWSSVAFLLALLGFGAKAGLLPVHVWLPEAHPAAPSPVSALMSGVMLKTAIYGLLRVSFDLIDVPLWWWGAVAMFVGLATAVFGVVFATVQSDMKRLLAYSSIENIGIIVAGLGLALMFRAFAMDLLAAVALAATLYHTLNHAIFKSLLFCATGAVLHATGERNLGRLGGLIHRMPWVAWLALVGTLAIAGVPPLNGFVSEWMLLQAFLFTPSLPHAFVNMLVPVGAAALALVSALSGYVMVKFYGVIFLGQPREPRLADAHDAEGWQRLGLAWLAVLCVLLGVLPAQVLPLLDQVNGMLLATSLTAALADAGTSVLVFAPLGADRASYLPAVLAGGIVLGVLVVIVLVRRLYHGRLRNGPVWDCGFPLQTPRMQDTAEGFGQPIRQVFEPFFRMQRELPSPFDAKPRYRVVVSDHLWHAIYLPIARVAESAARVVGKLQQGRIAVYLLYSFLTLLVLLAMVR